MLYLLLKKTGAKLQSENLVHSFFSVVLFHSGYVELIPMSSKVWLLPIIILGIYVSKLKAGESFLSKPLKIMFTLISLMEFLHLCAGLITNKDLFNLVPAFFTILFGLLYYSNSTRGTKNQEGVLLSGIHVLSILALYRLSFDYGSLAVTVAWGIYSIAIMMYGYLKKHSYLAKSSVIVLAITTMKALFYDASLTSSVNRILTLILTGIILYGAGYLFQKINSWEEKN